MRMSVENYADLDDLNVYSPYPKLDGYANSNDTENLINKTMNTST